MKLDKVIKKLPATWVEEADAMSEQELRDCIVQAERNMQVAKEEMEANEDFQEAKEAYKLAKAPLSDALKFQKAKIEYALHLLESKGKLE